MTLNGISLNIFLGIFCWLMFSIDHCNGIPEDISCLKAIKESLEDPLLILNSTWIFDNTTEGFICRFLGVQCWHINENRVLYIQLSDMGLKGMFPLGLEKCTSLTGLDLARNNLHGPIPSNISKILPYVTSLELSSNNFSGEIPADIANCSYLSVLKLDDNGLAGQIPAELGLLGRLKSFSVANNYLSGPVPNFNINANITAESYANNSGLCGDHLPNCRASVKESDSGTIALTAGGGLTVATVVMAVGMLFLFRMLPKRKIPGNPEVNKWARSIKGDKAIELYKLEKSVSKKSFSNLMKATNNFSKDNIIIGYGRKGTMYKGILEDGTWLMVKRLQDTHNSEEEFVSEMATLGNVKHSNLIPLLAFFMAKKERLLVYNFMPNGTLFDQLHLVNDGGNPIDWPTRLEIGIKAAKGFSWLHHICNPCIIHGNISSKCIFLDINFEPKISNFDAHSSAFEFGDSGYVATLHGDVYSFGIVLLELVTGERATHVAKSPQRFEGNLVEWITELSSTCKLEDAIDGSLSGKGFEGELFQFLKVACRCVLSIPKERPVMFQVYQLLSAIGEHHPSITHDEISMPSTTHNDMYVIEEFIGAEQV